MSKPRSRNYIPLSVDINGITIPAYLIPPGSGRASYYVRWQLGGKWRKRSTKQTVLHEAKMVGAEIVRGKSPDHAVSSSTLSFDRFVAVQEKHYAQRTDQRKAEKTRKKFRSVWDNFKIFNREVLKGRILVIQQVTDSVAVAYLEWLKKQGASAHGIHSKFSALSGSWNRVRRDHSKSKKTISESEKIDRNPWEAVSGELPEKPKRDPVQLDHEGQEFQRLLGAFAGRSVAQLLLIVSHWAAGRLEEITHTEWDWIDDKGYIDIPDNEAKWGKGRVVRIPPAILQRLKDCRESDSTLVFAGFREEYRRMSHHGTRMLATTADRLYETVGKHIVKAAKGVGLKDVSHHALRRTAMELSDQGEEIKATDESSKNLGTSTRNKDGFYVRKSHGRTFYLRADRLYSGLSLALLHYPAVADIMMVEDRFKPQPAELAKAKVQRLLEEMESLSAEEVLELERQKAERRRKKG